ncbi:glycosyltransferase [Ruminococcus sp.]|uniref:glycosyltransferase family 2 protein n=1 Tax=Ruminococcus sp. TaxID=41978 RepID=UPI0025EB7F03|nr:glycosyltransferase [Ruminococcus sp.]MBR1431507.1 glycosyltransferase [Ruminococcus sp.]
MNEAPLISVIVPAYNAEKWIGECCQSVFRQSYPNVELIAVDDGSTDSTLAELTRLCGSRDDMRVIHTENGGVCRARNVGLDNARGGLITFLDADDMLFDNALEVLYSLLSQTDADISIGWKRNISADGKELGSPYRREKAVYDGLDGLKRSLEDNPAMHSVWGKLYKKSAIGQLRFVEGRRVHEDSFFVFECMLGQPRVAVGEEDVLYYRISENSASRSGFSEKHFDMIYFADRKRALIEERYPELMPLCENAIVKANMALLWNLILTDDPKYRTVEKNAIQNVLDRKKYYKTALGSDAKLFWLITHGLYRPYKALHALKRTIIQG